MEQIPLRKTGKLLKRFEWPMAPEKDSMPNDPPRALKTLARIVDGDLCHRCGSCVGICPTKVLSVDQDEYPVVSNLSACTDCDLCVKVCPGDDFDVISVARQIFSEMPDIRDMHGHFRSSYLSYASDPDLRQNSTSGGLITAMLISLLERGIIDGAVVITSDKEKLWKGVPTIARTKEELLAATKSKYAISPTNKVFGEIRDVEGRYALVGLPCQIHGYHKAARLDKRIRDRVVLTIGLFCHAAIDHEPMEYIWNHLGAEKDQAVRFVSRIGKHPGTPHLQLENGKYHPVYFPEAENYRPSSMEILNILYRLYTPPRCLTCYDSTSEFADIAVGDPWLTPPDDTINFFDGYSFALARTERGETLLKESGEAGAVVLVPLDRKLAVTSNVMMGEEKRWRAFRVIETRRRQGHPTPNYGFKTPVSSGKQFILTEFNMLSHIFCYLRFGKTMLLRITFSKFGYTSLWLNKIRRDFREWRRDTFVRFKRKYFPPPIAASINDNPQNHNVS